MRHAATAIGTIAILLAGASRAMAADAPPRPPSTPDYAASANWLCRPDSLRFCAADLRVTIVQPDGQLRAARWHPPKRIQPIDCFYLYPTASLDNGSNSDLTPGDQPGEEIHTVRREFARFTAICRPFAPLYRSLTVTQMRGAAPPGDQEMAYGDARAAWLHYLAHDNDGRGVVLVGQSQGATILKRLIQEEIEGKPAQRLLVSALLPGTTVAVPPGRDVGGDFKAIKLCRASGQTGCVVTYNSFRADAPPSAGSQLARKRADGLINGCVNPAAMAGGVAPLDAYLEARYTMGEAGKMAQVQWTTSGRPVATPFVKVPGLLSGECRSDAHGDYLAVTLHGDPRDGRADDIRGDVYSHGKRLDQWGLHVVDMELVMGDLVRLVSAQAKAWRTR